MRAEVRAVISSDFDETTWKPAEPDNFRFWIQIFVGPEGHDRFEAEVCTPKWLLSNHDTDDVIIGWAKIIVFEYDWDRIERRIGEFVRAQTGDDWNAIALRVDRIGLWEFDPDSFPVSGPTQ